VCCEYNIGSSKEVEREKCEEKCNGVVQEVISDGK